MSRHLPKTLITRPNQPRVKWVLFYLKDPRNILLRISLRLPKPILKCFQNHWRLPKMICLDNGHLCFTKTNIIKLDGYKYSICWSLRRTLVTWHHLKTMYFEDFGAGIGPTSAEIVNSLRSYKFKSFIFLGWFLENNVKTFAKNLNNKTKPPKSEMGTVFI